MWLLFLRLVIGAISFLLSSKGEVRCITDRIDLTRVMSPSLWIDLVDLVILRIMVISVSSMVNIVILALNLTSMVERSSFACYLRFLRLTVS